MSIRTEKVASVIKRALVNPVSDLAHEYGAGLVTITSIRLSNDLHVAKVYLSIYGGKIGPGEFITFLENSKGMLRSHVGKHIRLRLTPDLRFFLDDTLDQMEHIQKLIDSVNTPKTNDPK